jgi:transcriptional regulator with XRE-family HTH domain
MPKKQGSDTEFSNELRKKILHLFGEENRTLQEIADSVGVTKQYVSFVLRKAKKAVKQDVDVSNAIAEIQRMGGLTLTDLANIIRVSREQVTRWANGVSRARVGYARQLELLKRALEYSKNNQ